MLLRLLSYRRGLRVVCSSIKGDAKASRCGTATVDFRAFLSVEPQGATGNTKQTNGNNNFDSDSKFVQQWANHPRGNGWHEGTITHAPLPCTIGYALRTHVSRGVTTLKLSAVKHKMSTILINTYYVYTTHRLSALWRLHGIYAPHAVSGTKNLHHLQVPPLWAVLVFGGGALLMPQSSVCIPLVRRAVAMPL